MVKERIEHRSFGSRIKAGRTKNSAFSKGSKSCTMNLSFQYSAMRRTENTIGPHGDLYINFTVYNYFPAQR